MTPYEVAAVLASKGYTVHETNTSIRAQCPAHGGSDLNLSLRLHPEGGCICTCHSHHCDRSAIAKALGLTMKDIVADTHQGNGSEQPNRIYPYRDEQGTVLYEVERTPDKKFWMKLPGRSAKEGVGNVRRVLFGIPELLLTKPGDVICIAEGEKCAVAVALLGITATTNPNGAGKWRQPYTDWLKLHLPDRRFLVLPDNDTEGKKHAVEVCESLKGAGLTVALADLGPLPEKGDVVQWIRAGGTAEQLRALASRAAASQKPKMRGYTAAELNQMVIPAQQWAIPKIVPAGLTILAGGQKKGKSRLLFDACLAVASGGMALGKIAVEQGEALYLALEDSDRRLQDRLREIVGDAQPPAGLHIYPEWPSIAEGGLDALRQWLSKHPKTRLVALDTIGVFRSGLSSKNSGVYQEDYDLGRSLLAIPREFGISLVGAHHTNKKEDWQDWTNGVSGSVGLTGAADATLLFERDRGSPEARLRGTGRDVQDFDLLLHWDTRFFNWVIQGTYEDEKRSPERYEILELVAKQGPLTPRDAADMLEKNYSTTKNLMVKMFRDGELSRKGGAYSIPTTAPPDGMEYGG